MLRLERGDPHNDNCVRRAGVSGGLVSRRRCRVGRGETSCGYGEAEALCKQAEQAQAGDGISWKDLSR